MTGSVDRALVLLGKIKSDLEEAAALPKEATADKLCALEHATVDLTNVVIMLLENAARSESGAST